tara:strand:+ start:145 stop:462 length:318 start_codon:yes stop_codon:yes gene_type:complete
MTKFYRFLLISIILFTSPSLSSKIIDALRPVQLSENLLYDLQSFEKHMEERIQIYRQQGISESSIELEIEKFNRFKIVYIQSKLSKENDQSNNTKLFSESMRRAK